MTQSQISDTSTQMPDLKQSGNPFVISAAVAFDQKPLLDHVFVRRHRAKDYKRVNSVQSRRVKEQFRMKIENRLCLAAKGNPKSDQSNGGSLSTNLFLAKNKGNSQADGR